MRYLLLLLMLGASSAALGLPPIRICAEAGYVPFETRDAHGKWHGFCPDLMDAFSRASGRDIQFVDVDWNGVIPALLTGKCDMITPSMAITPQRARIVAFSNPTFLDHIVIVKKNLGVLKDYVVVQEAFRKGEFDQKAMKIGSKQGASADVFVVSYFKHSKLIRYTTAVDLMNALLTGKVDAIVYDETFIRHFAKSHQLSLKVYRTGKSEKLGAGFAPQNKELLKKFNAFLEKFKKSKEYEDLNRRYF